MPKLNRPAVEKLLKEVKPLFEKEYAVNKIGIFGSYARDEQYGNSDIDIIVEFSTWKHT